MGAQLVPQGDSDEELDVARKARYFHGLVHRYQGAFTALEKVSMTDKVKMNKFELLWQWQLQGCQISLTERRLSAAISKPWD